MWHELVIFVEEGRVDSLTGALLKAGAAIFDEKTRRLEMGNKIVDFVSR
ncbi:hypothetical protein ACGFJT_31450 [Actinomadura geliboluensis]